MNASAATTMAPRPASGWPLALGALLSVPMATLTVSRTSEASLRGVVGVVTLALGIVALLKLL